MNKRESRGPWPPGALSIVVGTSMYSNEWDYINEQDTCYAWYSPGSEAQRREWTVVLCLLQAILSMLTLLTSHCDSSLKSVFQSQPLPPAFFISSCLLTPLYLIVAQYAAHTRYIEKGTYHFPFSPSCQVSKHMIKI